MPFASDNQRYACAVKMLGDCKLTARDCEGREFECKIRGSMRKRVYVNVGDWVLVADRGELGGNMDVIDKLAPQEVQYLRRIGEIREARAADEAEEDDVPVDFDADPDVDAV